MFHKILLLFNYFQVKVSFICSLQTYNETSNMMELSVHCRVFSSKVKTKIEAFSL